MDRVLQRSGATQELGQLGLTDLGLKVAGSLFWGMADTGWAAWMGLAATPGRVGRWLRARPPALAKWAKQAPDEAVDLALGGAIALFHRRWPIITLGSLAAATALAGQITPIHSLPQVTVQTAAVLRPKLAIQDDKIAPRVPRALTAGPAPLQRRLEALAEAFGEPVGVAVADVAQGWVTSVRGDMAFPQQSVSKLWVALTAMDAIDHGRMSLDQSVMLWPDDRSVFNQPISYRITEAGYATTVRDLLRRALIQSDNAANDKLMALVGGPSAVHEMLRRKALIGISLAEDEKHLQARIAGLTWGPELAPYGAFNTARSGLPQATREAAMEAYVAHPYDGASPVGIVAALSALHQGQLLSDGSTAVILQTMAKATTGPRRLKGGLPGDWTIAHKTGTGQDYRGASIGINDVALITAPDGRTYAVAVMMQRTRKPVSERLEFMQAVTKAVVQDWASNPTDVAALRPAEAAPQG